MTLCFDIPAEVEVGWLFSYWVVCDWWKREDRRLRLEISRRWRPVFKGSGLARGPARTGMRKRDFKSKCKRMMRVARRSNM